MDLLKAVNTILPWMEENKVTTVDTKHPTVAMVLANLDYHRGLVLDHGYWFNRETRTYYLTPEGTVEAPTSTRAFYTEDKTLHYEIRGEYVYDMDSASYFIKEPFRAITVVDLDFEQLPEVAANVVLWRACIDSYLPDFGVTQSVQGMQLREQAATAMLEREHLRKSRYSTRRSASAFRFMNALRS